MKQKKDLSKLNKKNLSSRKKKIEGASKVKVYVYIYT